MKQPLVSVIMPIYNVGEYLRRAVHSVLEQSYENLEVILVDDGSTDGCSEIVDEFARVDKRVVAMHQKNAGQSAARNAGIKLAKGEFLSFVDGDDEIREDFVEKLVAASQNNTLAATGMHYRKLYNDTANDVYVTKIRKQKTWESIEEYVLWLLILDGRMYGVINKLFRAEVIQKKQLRFQEKVNFAEDTNFVLDYIKASGCKIDFVLEPLYVYNAGTATSTVKKSGAVWKNWQKSYDYLRQWAGKKPSLVACLRLKMILARWRISYWKTKKRAKV